MYLFIITVASFTCIRAYICNNINIIIITLNNRYEGIGNEYSLWPLALPVVKLKITISMVHGVLVFMCTGKSCKLELASLHLYMT